MLLFLLLANIPTIHRVSLTHYLCVSWEKMLYETIKQRFNDRLSSHENSECICITIMNIMVLDIAFKMSNKIRKVQKRRNVEILCVRAKSLDILESQAKSYARYIMWICYQNMRCNINGKGLGLPSKVVRTRK